MASTRSFSTSWCNLNEKLTLSSWHTLTASPAPEGFWEVYKWTLNHVDISKFCHFAYKLSICTHKAYYLQDIIDSGAQLMDLIVHNGTPHWGGNIGKAAKESGITTSGGIKIDMDKSPLQCAHDTGGSKLVLYNLCHGSLISWLAVGLCDGSSCRQRTIKAAVDGRSVSCNTLYLCNMLSRVRVCPTGILWMCPVASVGQ